MAVIGKIRERSTLLLVLVGGALAAFILGDLFSNKRGSFGGSGADQSIGSVYGSDIDRQNYELKVSEELESRQSVGQPANSQMSDQIRDQVWNQMTQEIIVNKEIEKLGLTITPEEYDDIRFGENVSEMFTSDPTFKNKETGNFDPALVKQYFAFVQEKYPLYWKLQKDKIISDRLSEKYNNLVKKAIYSNKLDAKDKFTNESNKLTFSFVEKKYNSVADSTITVSDADLEQWYSKHKSEKRFDQKPSRDINYIAFEVVPTAADEQLIKDKISELANDFKNTTNDSLFIAKSSETKNTQVGIYKPGESSSPLNDSLFANVIAGQIVGPFKEGNYYKLAKIVGFADEPQARVRHILLQSNPTQDMVKLKAKADSIIKVIRANKNFEQMVMQFSDDPGSKNTGGVYEWFGKERMVPEFTAASFDNPVGTITTCQTQYGIHIIEVLGKRSQQQMKYYSVDKQIVPSKETFNAVYDVASEFSINNSDTAKFNKVAKEKNYTIVNAKNVAMGAKNVSGLQEARELTRWAYAEKTEIGNVSEPFESADKYVVGALVSVKEEGIADLKDVKDMVKNEVIKEKKVELFSKELAGTSIEEIAKKNGLTVEKAEGVTLASSSLSGAGYEPYVVGAASMTQKGKTSQPLKGRAGVFVIQLENKVVAEIPKALDNEKQTLATAVQNKVSSINGDVLKALKELAKVKDERGKFN
jgi:peptidyl-prolyl cis-trans isomerase D